MKAGLIKIVTQGALEELHELADAEIYLLKNGFMKIDGKREITGKGVKALEKIK